MRFYLAFDKKSNLLWSFFITYDGYIFVVASDQKLNK